MTIELLTGVLVVITGFYAWVTLKILRANERVVAAMQEQAVALSRPYVGAAPFLEFDNPIFYLRIKNSGRSAAFNLRLKLDKSFQKFGEPGKSRDLSSFIAFNEPIQAFAPDAEIIFSLAQSFKVFGAENEGESMPKVFTITAEYEFGDQKVSEVNVVDLRPYLNADVPQEAYVRKLEGINQSLKTIAKRGGNVS